MIEIEDPTLLSFPSPSVLHNFLATFDIFFFIQYTLEDTLKPRYFLVQINHVETAFLKIESKKTDDYHAIFLSQHPNDNYLGDENYRWWPLWHEYQNDTHNVPIYGAYILFGPKRKPDTN